MQEPADSSSARGRPRGGEQRIPRPADWLPADPTPWYRDGGATAKLSLADVRRRLADLPSPHPAPAPPPELEIVPRPSAVLVPLFEAGGEARIILTKRPETMPTHQGEIAFPGGKLDPQLDPDLRGAALREAKEEIGLDPSLVEIVAELDGIGTLASRFVIAPFVGLLAQRPVLHADPREVVRVFDISLSELLAPGVHHAERWPASTSVIELHFFELADETVWGATARILYGFLRHLTAEG